MVIAIKNNLSKLNKIEELLNRGVAEIIDKSELESKLQSSKKLRIKFGIDPTSPNIHLGRSIPLLKLKDFQELGHKIVLIIGDFTGLIGDTSDKDSERPMLSEKVVKENLKKYIEQIAKIIDIKKVEVHYNSEWFKKLSFMELNHLADVFSLHDFNARENINKRLKEGKRISLREMLYPIMQGYDSVQVKADVEIGGTDQRFNMLAGRDLQKLYKQKPQNIITLPIIEGLDGRKMSSSWGNTINLLDTPNDMFIKIMSVQDNLIIKYFILLTRVDMEIIKNYENDLKNNINPREIKIKLAHELVKNYHSEKKAQIAEDYFIKTFSKKEIPDDLLNFKPISGDYNIISVLVESKLASSNGDARRIIEQNGVKINGIIVKEINYTISPGEVLQKGKIKFLKIM